MCGDLRFLARLRFWRSWRLGEEVVNPLKFLFLHLNLLSLEFSQLLPQGCYLELGLHKIIAWKRLINDLGFHLDWVDGLLVEEHLEEPDGRFNCDSSR